MLATYFTNTKNTSIASGTRHPASFHVKTMCSVSTLIYSLCLCYTSRMLRFLEDWPVCIVHIRNILTVKKKRCRLKLTFLKVLFDSDQFCHNDKDRKLSVEPACSLTLCWVGRGVVLHVGVLCVWPGLPR